MDERIQRATKLWTLAQPVISAYVVSIVRDFESRDDVLQETAVGVIESFDSYDPQRPFIAWAMGIARNQIRLYLRRKQRECLVFDDQVLQQLAGTFEQSPAEEFHSLTFLRDCLKHLEGRAGEICQLRYAQNLKPALIAKSIGMTSNGVAKVLQRIREQLRECVERKASTEGVAP